LKQIKLLLIPIAVALTLALLAFAFGLIPDVWQPYIFILVIALALIPVLEEIYRTARLKKIDLSIPVVITILILLYIGNYWVAGIFMLLITLGEIFKKYILWRVEQSVNEISKALPDTAFLKDGEIREIKIRDIKKGDLLVIKAGGRAPVDGTLTTGDVSMDESVITGESRLVPKHKGDHITAGAINQSDYLEMTAADTSENSTLAQIHKMVEEAQSRSTPLSRFTTKFAGINSLAALIGAITIYAITKDLKQSLAFWIALVPVIFAIIVPVATTIGISILAKKGVMIKNGEALENLTRINSIVFDKTGTLTKGAPEITDIVITDKKYNENSFLELAASIEKYSEHPLGRPVVKKAEAMHLSLHPVEDVRVIKGKGMQGIYRNKKVLIGKPQFIEESNIVVDNGIKKITQEKESEANTPIFVAIDNALAGAVFISDQLRPGIRETIAALKAMNIKLTMLTGDNKTIAEKIANNVGLAHYYGELLPQDKIKYIQQFRQQGERVAMIGDGINDAPALSEANIGIAMGLRGVDVTLNAAEVVLIKDNINALPYMLATSKKVLSIIRFNLFIATGIHAIAATLIITGTISILGSAIIHQLSSAIVMLNTLRIFGIKTI
jgi:Cd2+/Zn2+-exporting ATPase